MTKQKEVLPDFITIKWCIDDVLVQAENKEYKLTKDDARKILQDIKRKHSCTLGITWETIDLTIDNYIDEYYYKLEEIV